MRQGGSQESQDGPKMAQHGRAALGNLPQTLIFPLVFCCFCSLGFWPPKWLQEAPRWFQNGSKKFQDCHQRPQDGPKMARDGHKSAQNGPNLDSGGLKMALRWPEQVCRGFKRPQDGSKKRHDGPKLSLRCPKTAPRWLNMAAQPLEICHKCCFFPWVFGYCNYPSFWPPKWPQEAPRWFQDVSKRL